MTDGARQEGVMLRGERCLGAGLLAHFAGVCAVKITTGCAEELLWMSHVGLLLGGLGLLLRSRLLTATALTSVLTLHAIWLADAACWVILGFFPLRVTTYLVTAGPWAWLATAHHFYLAPLLVIVILRARTYPPAAWLTAVAVFQVLTLISRAFLEPAANVNYAFGILPSVDHPLVNWVNRQPGSIYLPGLHAFVGIVLLLPAMLTLRYRISSRRRPMPSCGPEHRGYAPAPRPGAALS